MKITRIRGTNLKRGPALWWARMVCKVRGHDVIGFWCERCQSYPPQK